MSDQGIVDQELAQQLVDRAKAEGLKSMGPGWPEQADLCGDWGQIKPSNSVTVDGERDILGLWTGQGGEGAKYGLTVLTEIKNRGVADVCIVCCGCDDDGVARLESDGVATGDRADLCAAPDPPHVPCRRPSRLGTGRESTPSGLHRTDRSRCT